MRINAQKYQVLHVCNYQKPRSSTPLYCCNQKLKYTHTYIYLGYLLQEHLSEKLICDALTAAARRSFGRVVILFKKLKNMGIKTYESLYESYVLSIADYTAAVWGFHDHPPTQILQNRIERFYLGIHTFAPVASTNKEFNWLDMRSLRWVELVRYLNRLKSMKQNRWPKKVFQWDKSFKTEGWSNQVREIVAYANMSDDFDSLDLVDLDALKTRLLKARKDGWLLEAYSKLKLRTFIQLYDDESPRNIVEANLPRNHRSLLSKLKMGVLPLGIETGRWKDTPLEY